MEDYFEDNRYNIGFIKSTAAFGHGFGVVTSLTALFFEKCNIVRPEDWHRGLSLLLASAA